MDGSFSTMSNDEDDSFGVQATASPNVLNHPAGRDQSKRKRRGGGDSSTMEAFQKSLAEMAASSATHGRLAISREEREKAKEARENAKYEREIMLQDLSQLDPQQRAWYQAQRDQIMSAYQPTPSHTPEESTNSPYDDTYTPTSNLE
ncbi:unnamed protein product [Linum trigynum]|uniref:No apical meristem-associated C-terminal domain-containing protein n=1 Tax=Linum trigynum TaxID=586398 RepID=A0AAV2CZU1_9ROSI